MSKTVICPYCEHVNEITTDQNKINCSKCGEEFIFESFELDDITLVSGRKITLTPKVYEALLKKCEDFYDPDQCIYFDKKNFCGIKGCPILFISNKEWDRMKEIGC